jgi:hypothetical protein
MWSRFVAAALPREATVSDAALMNPPAITSLATSNDLLADLILARLLPAKSSVSPKKLRDDLSPLFQQALSVERIGETLEALRARELVIPKGQQLTAAGRTWAMAYLGIAELPPKANWGTVKAKYLVPKALRLSATSESDVKTCGDAKKLAPLLLKRVLGLPVGTGNSLGAAFEAIACRELGYRDHTKLKDLIPHLLGKAIGSGEPIGMKEAEKVVPRVLLDAPKAGMEGLRAVALVGLANTAPPRPVANLEAFDLESFANTVKSVARTSPTGRFGDNKVFINHVWRQVEDEPRFAPLGLAGFKEKLVEANRENLLTLSRADLVQVMDLVDVRESETAYLNAVYHFILVEKQ